MQVTLDIPDEIAAALGNSPEDVGRKMMERYALDEYSAGRFGHFAVQTLLGLASWQETEKFLRANRAELQYGPEDLQSDLETLRDICR